jgi:ubiquinone/menaquinone biosynthesis C-methylase UbiE
LQNFTTSLPFNDSNFNIALLSFGTINGSQIFGPFRSYSEFCDVVHKQWEVSQQFGLYEADLNEYQIFSKSLKKNLEQSGLIGTIFQCSRI